MGFSSPKKIDDISSYQPGDLGFYILAWVSLLQKIEDISSYQLERGLTN